MAKWGEGDPRWIVEERPDATNVNNWHWTEKNASEWSKFKLRELLEGFHVEEPGLGEFTIKDMCVCDGEAIANSRKGKLIFFYEWVIQLDWEANSLFNPDVEIKGKIDIPNLSEENDASDIDISVSVTTGGSEGQKFRDFVNSKVSKEIQAKLGEYIIQLREEYAPGMLLPTKDQAKSTGQKKTAGSVEAAKNFKEFQIKSASRKEVETGVSFQTTKLTCSENFKCTAQELYNVLTSQELAVAFTRGPVQLEAEKGGPFSFFDGNITGKFTLLEPPTQIKQTWRRREWPAGHYSEVIITLSQDQDSTTLQLTQSGIPAGDLEKVTQGWNTYYWESIKRTFGFASILM